MSDNTKHLAKKCVKDAGGRVSHCALPAQRSRCWLFWGHSTCSEAPALCTSPWPLPAP